MMHFVVHSSKLLILVKKHSKMSSNGSEHLAAVHDNPFIRKFGLPAHQTRQEPPDSESPIPSSASSDRGDDDTEQEYHVNSGFVNKLRSKFAQLENKSHKVTLSKKSASVENLLHISSSNDAPVRNRKWQKDDSSVTTSAAKVDLRQLAPAGYKPQIRRRPGSCDLETPDKSNVNKKKGIEFLHQNNVIRSVKPPLPTKISADSSRNKRYSRKPSNESIVPKTEHHDWKVAPDLEKIGRDNIVIIESKEPEVKEPKEKAKTSVNTNEDSPDGFRRVKPLADKDHVVDENELPKPNTVSQYRTLFEKTNKTRETLGIWRHQSPPRKSSGSDTQSPVVASPVSTPRSPLKTNDDNVFEDSSKINVEKETDKTYSPRNSSNLDTNVSSPRNSSSVTDYSQNVDTTPTSSIQKSLEMFNRRGSEDQEWKSDSNRNSYSDKDVNSSRPLSPSIQHTLTPVHPMSKIFDSNLVSKKTEKSKKPKPTIAAKKQHVVPKDTLELKHEADRRKKQELELQQKKEKLAIEITEETLEDVDTETVSGEPNIKPSSKTGKISPRKTKIFDSNNIVKKNREPPKVVQDNNKDVSSKELPNNVPKQVSIEIKDLDAKTAMNDNETEIAMETSPIKPSTNKHMTVNSGLTELKPNIINTVDNKVKQKKFKVKEQNFIKAENVNEQEKTKHVVKASKDQTKAPVSGMSSFLASQLRKTQPDQENQLKTSSVHLANGSSPVPKKRQAPERPVSNGPSMNIEENLEKSAPPLPSTPEPPLLKNNENLTIRQKKKTQPATKLVFDSSKIATKRKEPPKRKPPRKTLEQVNQNLKVETSVPKLDLTSITGDQGETEYTEGYIPTVIKPCPFKFLGAEVTFAKTPYKKTGKSKKVSSFYHRHKFVSI